MYQSDETVNFQIRFNACEYQEFDRVVSEPTEAFETLFTALGPEVGVETMTPDQLQLMLAQVEQSYGLAFPIDYIFRSNGESFTLLSKAIVEENLSLVQWLVEEKDADVNLSIDHYHHPLTLACSASMLEYLMDHGSCAYKSNTIHYNKRKKIFTSIALLM